MWKYKLSFPCTVIECTWFSLTQQLLTTLQENYKNFTFPKIIWPAKYQERSEVCFAGQIGIIYVYFINVFDELVSNYRAVYHYVIMSLCRPWPFFFNPRNDSFLHLYQYIFMKFLNLIYFKSRLWSLINYILQVYRCFGLFGLCILFKHKIHFLSRNELYFPLWICTIQLYHNNIILKLVYNSKQLHRKHDNTNTLKPYTQEPHINHRSK